MKAELQHIIGRNLLHFRNAQGLTREQLAEKVGISVTFYSNLESGNRMMSVPTLCKLAEALCVSTDALLYENHPKAHTRNVELLMNSQNPKAAHLSEQIVRLISRELKDEP